MPKYGLISAIDSNTLELTLRLIFEHFQNDVINVTEVGIYGGETGNGMKEFIEGNGRKCFLTGIDNNKDNEPLRYKYDNLIIGNSNEVYNRVEDNSQHLIFVDGDHSFAGVVSDFFCYAEKVKRGGYVAFHDTGKHIKPFSGFQHGDKENPDAYISVRKALGNIGMFVFNNFKWKFVSDDADTNDPMGGICVFKKMH